MGMGKKTVDQVLKKFQTTVRDLSTLATTYNKEAEVKEAKRDELNRGIDADRREQRRAEILVQRFEKLLDTSDLDEATEAPVEEAQ